MPRMGLDRAENSLRFLLSHILEYLWDIIDYLRMSEGINVRLPGKLQEFVKRKSDPDHGFFSSASEYIRDLVRHDFEIDERRKWDALKQELGPGQVAEESEFRPVSAEQVIAEAKRRKAEGSEE